MAVTNEAFRGSMHMRKPFISKSWGRERNKPTSGFTARSLTTLSLSSDYDLYDTALHLMLLQQKCTMVSHGDAVLAIGKNHVTYC